MIQQPETHRAPTVIDVDESNFQQEIVARSQETLVVVDFWASWCGPCRTLGPLLERLAAEFQGNFILAKINVDTNQRLATMFKIQGIPAVKAFRNGRIVDEFTGALPESRIREWLKRHLPPPPDPQADELAALTNEDPHIAETRYRQILADDPQNTAALLGLGRLLVIAGETEGPELLHTIPLGTSHYPMAQAWLTIADLLTHATTNDPHHLETRIAANPNDLLAHYQIAAHYTRQATYADAIPHLLIIVARDRTFCDDGARRTLLALFEIMGDQNPLTVSSRRQLANLLF